MISGALGLVWCAAWQFLVSNTPAEHGRIHPDERDHIVESLKGQVDYTVKVLYLCITLRVMQILCRSHLRVLYTHLNSMVKVILELGNKLQNGHFQLPI